MLGRFGVEGWSRQQATAVLRAIGDAADAGRHEQRCELLRVAVAAWQSAERGRVLQQRRRRPTRSGAHHGKTSVSKGAAAEAAEAVRESVLLAGSLREVLSKTPQKAAAAHGGPDWPRASKSRRRPADERCLTTPLSFPGQRLATPSLLEMARLAFATPPRKP